MKISQSVQLLSHVWLFATPWTAARQASLSIINSWSLLEFMSIASVMPSNHLILCHPLLLPPSIFPSIRVFSNESVLHIRWPKYWSFSFSISPSNEYSGLIFFRIDCFDLLAVQGTCKSLLQHHSSKASCHINEQEILPPSVISGLQMWMKAPQIVIQRMLLPAANPGDCWRAGVMQEARWTRKQDWPQIAEVRVKWINSVSPEACIFPHTEC